MLEIALAGILGLLIGYLVGSFMEWNERIDSEDSNLKRIDNLQRYARALKSENEQLKADLFREVNRG